MNSRAIYEFLMGEGPRVYDQGLASGRFTDVILTNLLHTSVVSGFSCGVNQLALAHGLYDLSLIHISLKNRPQMRRLARPSGFWGHRMARLQ